MMGCKNCGHESHCNAPLRKDVDNSKKEIVVCHMCRCEECEKKYERWADTACEWDDSYTDERIV